MSDGATVHPGKAAPKGTYLCVDCGYELNVDDVSSMPPCPHTSDERHSRNTWQRRRRYTGLAMGLAVGGVVLGTGLLVYAVGTRRIAAEARLLAEQSRLLADEGTRAARQVADEGRRVAAKGLRRSRRVAESWLR